MTQIAWFGHFFKSHWCFACILCFLIVLVNEKVSKDYTKSILLIEKSCYRERKIKIPFLILITSLCVFAHICECRCPWHPEEGVGLHWSWVTGRCKLKCGCRELNLLWLTCGGQKTTCGSQFLSSRWILVGTKPWSSGLAARNLTHCTISPALGFVFWFFHFIRTADLCFVLLLLLLFSWERNFKALALSIGSLGFFVSACTAFVRLCLMQLSILLSILPVRPWR